MIHDRQAETGRVGQQLPCHIAIPIHQNPNAIALAISLLDPRVACLEVVAMTKDYPKVKLPASNWGPFLSQASTPALSSTETERF